MKAKHHITLPLNERNFAHVLAALALTGIAAKETAAWGKYLDSRATDRGQSISAETAEGDECCCFWNEEGFNLHQAFEPTSLFQRADEMLRSLQWVEGLGVDEKLTVVSKAHHGVFARDNEIGTNPFISLVTSGAESSLLKTFSCQVDPGKILASQLERLQHFEPSSDWLMQRCFGVNSWGLDPSVGSHAYDLGFGSNEEGSGDADPVYPAIELLSLAGVAFYSAPHAWQKNEETCLYFIWQDRLPIPLASLAAGGVIDGLRGNSYMVATRGGTYGKGAAYRYFPEASAVKPQ